jgi:hypothetical protein
VTEERFSWDVIAKQFAGVFQDVLEDRFRDHAVPVEETEEEPIKENKKKKKRVIGK